MQASWKNCCQHLKRYGRCKGVSKEHIFKALAMYKYMFTYPGESFHFSAYIYKFKEAELIFGGIVRPMLFQRQSARCLHLGNYFF